jgi:hypothetical protein
VFFAVVICWFIAYEVRRPVSIKNLWRGLGKGNGMHSKSLLLVVFLMAGTAEAAAKSNEGCLQAGRESERLSKVVLGLVKACNQKPNGKTRHELCEQLKLSLAAEKHEVSVCHAGEASKSDAGDPSEADGVVDVEKGVRWAQTWIDHLNENPSFCR